MLNNTKPVKQRKFKLNIIDFAIVIALIACIAGVGVRFWLTNRQAAQTRSDGTAEVIAVYFGVSESTAKSYIKDDKVYIEGYGTAIGRVTKAETENSTVYVPDENGMLTAKKDSSSYDVTLTLSINGKATEKGFILSNGEYLIPGMNVVIETSHSSTRAALITGVTPNADGVGK